MLAGGDLEFRLAYSEIASVRLSIPVVTDGLDVITFAMNKGVGVFARSGQVSLFPSCYYSICHSGPLGWHRSACSGSLCICSHLEPGPVGSDPDPA